MNDYQFGLTDKGRERARRLVEHCTYFGAAPVPLSDYIDRRTGTVAHEATSHADDLKAGLRRLLINQRMLPARAGDQFGPRPVPVWRGG